MRLRRWRWRACSGWRRGAAATTIRPTRPPTTEAPATTAAPATTTAPATTAGGGGDAAAVEEGQIFFASTCTGCHLDNGTAGGGVGPQLAGAGLTEDQIREQVINGGGAMPPGLAQGQDLDNVTAYVLSLQ